jgi:hypothetical protein
MQSTMFCVKRGMQNYATKNNISSVERVVFPAIMLVAQQALHALRIQTLVVES